jgi:orotate phosphoribosyltransferase
MSQKNSKISKKKVAIPMQPYKQDFIDFMVRSGVLTFGDFTTKSGRKTPFFINTGNYKTGAQIARLGRFYAEALLGKLGREFDNLYGPAYKGIPLCVTAASALAQDFDHDVTFTFNRKEAKDHGEGGSLIGYKYKGGERVVIIEDVITAGTSVRESAEILKDCLPAGTQVDWKAVVVSVDRQERGGDSGKSALTEISEEYGVQVFAIVTLDEIVRHLHGREIDGKAVLKDELLERIAAYRAQYGVK